LGTAIPLAKSAFVFENGYLNHGSVFAKASSFATSFAEATAVKKATADKMTDGGHGVHRVKMR
jgi:hypothetical protein